VPRGVRTSAESEGIFKETQVRRSTQMELAEGGGEE
jgi:hypothetical protein